MSDKHRADLKDILYAGSYANCFHWLDFFCFAGHCYGRKNLIHKLLRNGFNFFFLVQIVKIF